MVTNQGILGLNQNILMVDTPVKYCVFEKPGVPLKYKTRSFLPKPGVGETLVKIRLSTICGSDIHTIDGKRKEDTPCILGHEAVGEIVTTNSRHGFKTGDRVTWSIADSCGHCSACTDYQLPEKCDHLFKYGHASISDGTGLNGCYASHIIIRKGTHMVKVPNTISDAVVAPANCALSTMINAVSHIPGVPEKVVVQGGGLLGLYACGLLKEHGISQVYCLEIKKESLALISSFGAIPVDANHPQQAIDQILKQSSGPVDVVIEVAGIKDLIPQGIALLRPGGTYILAGLVHPNSQMEVTAEQIIRKCLTIKGVHNYSPKHLDQAVAFLERNVNRLPFESLVSPPFLLSELDTAVMEAKGGAWGRVSVKPD